MTDATATTNDRDEPHDVVIVGGGPAGCSAGVFCARYGLDTVIFDRGRSSIQRCAHLENYPGFPAGIDIETLYDLLHDHAMEAGCQLADDLVGSVERTDDGNRFLVEPQEGSPVTADRVIAATRYDGEYLWSLDDEDEMKTTYEHDGEEHEQFDREYPGSDGETPIEGLYVASPSSEADQQAVVAAGRGARVALRLIADLREERGYPDEFADCRDWVRREAELDDEWSDRAAWREWFEDRLPDDHGLDERRLETLREREIDRYLATYVSDEEIDRRAERGQARLLDHVDDELVLERAREIRTEDAAPEVSD